jgi:hypothetical protein
VLTAVATVSYAWRRFSELGVCNTILTSCTLFQMRIEAVTELHQRLAQTRNLQLLRGYNLLELFHAVTAAVE